MQGEEYKELYRIALAASENAYAPYSGFPVGAAVMTRDGEIFTGVNVENASYGATVCAERSAISAAVAAGRREFKAVASASPEGAAYPCGICRQVIFEFGDDIKVVTGTGEDALDVCDIKDLLPKGFRL